MTETELTIIDNIVNQTVTDIATGFTLEYFDYSQGKSLDLNWVFDKKINNSYNIFIEITINKDKEIYYIRINCVIYNTEKSNCIVYSKYIDYSADCIDIDTLVNTIKQTYNNVISKYNANIGVE